MDAMHPRWDDLRLLLAVARGGSFVAAGRELGVSTSTLSRRLTGFEAAVGTPLVERRADGTRLTEVGRRLSATAEEVELALHARLRELPTGDRLAGVVRVTAGDGFAAFLSEAIASFAVRHPAVAFDLTLDNRRLDLPRREADLAIRTVHAREGSLVYRSVGALPYGLFTAPAYAARAGLPRSLRDLSRHAFVGSEPALGGVPWMRWLARNGATRFVLRSTSFAALVAAARAGLGIAALPLRLGGDLVRVLPRTAPDPLPVWVVSHPDARRVPAVRAFAEHLTGAFRAETDLAR